MLRRTLTLLAILGAAAATLAPGGGAHTRAHPKQPSTTLGNFAHLHMHRMTMLIRTPHGTQAHTASTWYGKVYSEYDRMCVGIQGGSTSVDAHVRAGYCNNTAADQNWYIESGGNGPQCGIATPCWLMLNAKSHLCADWQYNSTSNGTAIIQYYCNGADPGDNLGMEAYGTAGGCPFVIHHWTTKNLPSGHVIAKPGNTYGYPENLVEWDYPNLNFPINAQWNRTPCPA